MASGIFLSWSSPDKHHVFPLRDRLRAVGLTVWEYSDDLPAGSDIHEDIVKTINQVQVAILCFSDATASADWIVKEANWCVKTLMDGDRPLRHVLPVWIGPHPRDLAPTVVKERNLRIADLSGGREAALRQFVADLFTHLGLDAPRIVPAALFAMTRRQWRALRASGIAPALSAACAAAGIPSALQAPAFRKRYGARPEELAPFRPGHRLLDTVEKTLSEANRTRVARRKRPIFLSWVRDTLVGPAPVQSARDEWAAGDSLLVVDSVSTFHPQVQVELLNLPQPKRPERAALLWIPPYTQHTAPLEDALGAAAMSVGHLGDAFSDWRRSFDRALAFDTSTPTSVRSWLRRAFLAIEDQAEPVVENVSMMRAASAHRVSLADLLPGGRPP